MFSEKIKELRKKHNLTQTELSEKINVAFQTVGAWESGRNEPNYDMLNTLAKLFDVTVDYLTGKNTKDIEDTNLKNIINELENDKELNAKVRSITELNPEERKKIYKILDAVIDEDK